MRRALSLALALSLTGCTALSNEPARVQLVEPESSCSEALAASVTGLQRLGYTIVAVERARPDQPGKVTATRAKGYSAASPEASGEASAVTVEVRCSDAGATVDAVSNESGMERVRFPGSFSEAFRSAVVANRRPDPVVRRVEPERGLVVDVRPLRGFEASEALGQDVAAVGLTAVRIEIDNRGERAVRFDATAVRLVTTQGERRSPSTAADLAKLGATGAAVAQAQIESGDLAPGAKRSGFLFFPAASYARASVVLTDIESGESEGLSIRF